MVAKSLKPRAPGPSRNRRSSPHLPTGAPAVFFHGTTAFSIDTPCRARLFYLVCKRPNDSAGRPKSSHLNNYGALTVWP